MDSFDPMILLIAWRNIWRNKTRSIVVIVAVTLGIWAALFMSGFATGMINGMVGNSIDNILAHIELHHPQYHLDSDIHKVIKYPEEKLNALKNDPVVDGVAARSIVNGMIASSTAARGIQIKAVNYSEEVRISKLHLNMTDGEYFSDEGKNPILIGKELADDLKVEIKNKIVLSFQDRDGNIISGAFRILGYFDSGSDGFNKSTVFIRMNDFNRLIGMPEDSSLVHEIAVLLKNKSDVNYASAVWKGKWPDTLVESYAEISPELKLYESQMSYVSLIYLSVIMLALIFGIINTMLMAVLERMRELGMLMAIGMNKTKVFIMVMIETFLLTIVGVPIGLFFGFLTIQLLGRYGINLSAYSESLKQYGISKIIYFDILSKVYWQVPVVVFFTAIIASIYPAIKAISLKPVEALRKI